MAIYRNIQMSFWTDTKVIDEFSPEQKLLYLYLLTNPHTNLSGCYEISKRQIAYETGMTAKQVNDNLSALQNDLRVVVYSDKTKEILLVNWSKYNWTASEKFRKPLEKEILSVKDEEFQQYLSDLFDGSNTVSIPYEYGTDTTVTVTVTDTDTDSLNTARTRARETQTDMFERLITGRAVNQDMKNALRDWVAYKQERREAYQEKGMASLITQAVNRGAEHGADAVCTTIRESMASGYKGIVWDRIGKRQNQKFNNEAARVYDMDELEKELLATN